LALPLDREVTIRLGENVRQEMIRALADLLLEVLGEAASEATEARNESEA
jgi:hypothetical protein